MWRSELIVGNPRQVDDHYPRSPVHRTVVHARMNLPIDVFSAPRLCSDQYDSHSRIPEIPVSDLAPDLLIGPVFRNVARIDGSIHEYGILLSESDQFFLVLLIVIVMVANEYLVHCRLHC